MMENSEIFPDTVLQSIRKDRAVRLDTVSRSHLWFFHVYLAGYVKCPMAPFHRDMFQVTEDASINLAVVMAFRGSAKSTILSMSYPIWAVLGEQQRKHIWLVSQTQPQARSLLTNIRAELEDNELLRRDLGPFEQQDDEWGSSSIVLPKYGARITAASVEQSVRGLRHRASRPDLVIIDDVENIASVKTHESRTKTYEWLTGEIFPAGDTTTRFLLIGNYLHDESVLARVSQSIQTGQRKGYCMRVPLLDEEDNIAWPGKYPDIAAIEAQKALIGDSRAFQREFQLQSVGVVNQIVNPEWITYYDQLPHAGFDHQLLFSAIGIDLALIVSDTSDFTCMVAAHVYKIKGKLKIFILPSPINKRMEFPETLATAERFARTVRPGYKARLYIEEVGYQASLIQTLKNKYYYVIGFKPQGSDKASRLTLTTPAIQDGTILFPRMGAEIIIRQITGLGSEKYDDAADAFAILTLTVLEEAMNHISGTVRVGTMGKPIFSYNPFSANINRHR
jgi:predicted phage terminase large subunit-like protein